MLKHGDIVYFKFRKMLYDGELSYLGHKEAILAHSGVSGESLWTVTAEVDSIIRQTPYTEVLFNALNHHFQELLKIAPATVRYKAMAEYDALFHKATKAQSINIELEVEKINANYL